jgi:hypothetical protein
VIYIIVQRVGSVQLHTLAGRELLDKWMSENSAVIDGADVEVIDGEMRPDRSFSGETILLMKSDRSIVVRAGEAE